MVILGIQLTEGSPTIEKVEKVIAMKIERKWIHFFSDVFAAIAVLGS